MGLRFSGVPAMQTCGIGCRNGLWGKCIVRIPKAKLKLRKFWREKFYSLCLHNFFKCYFFLFLCLCFKLYHTTWSSWSKFTRRYPQSGCLSTCNSTNRFRVIDNNQLLYINSMVSLQSKVAIVDKLTITFLVDNCIEWCVTY